ncbi:MAG: moaA [Burkholderiaceae bacterium]|nr:moaA [Burkholderiaceae bacterium]
MNHKIIPIASYHYPNAVPAVPQRLEQPDGLLTDAHGRPLRDLRISVTDRCNFRCTYCMPKTVFGKDFLFQPHASLLSFEEITRLAKIFVAHGVEKLRLTGGEPLLRKDVERLIAQLSALRTPDGRELDLTLTTNGSLLAKKALSLRDAGLKRLTVSLDALDDAVFRQMNDVDYPVASVLHGIEMAQQAGFDVIKLNMVVRRGVNEREILPMARHFKGTRFIVRFIEYMDVGSSNEWNLAEVVPSSDIIRMIDAEMPLEQIDANYAGETAERWRYLDGGGEIGVIASVTHAFCSDCSRVRLATDGKLYTCLFATQGHDLRALLRAGRSDIEIASALAQLWRVRDDRYSELRASLANVPQKKIEMSYIGG